MSKYQHKSSSSGGNSRGDVSFIRATSNNSQSSVSNSNPSNQQASNLDKVADMQHYDMGPPSHHIPHQSHSSQEISQHAFQSSVQDIPQHHSRSLHHYHHHHQRSSKQQQQQQHQQQHPSIEQYHPTDLPDQNPFLIPGGGEMPSHTGVESWGSKEEALAAELEEAKIRVAQMEKTMRWWSDCTSNWREKWNKARNERNKAREENRILRVKLESVSKEISRLKREKRELAEDKKSEGGKLSKSSSSSSQHHKSSQDNVLSELSEKEKTVSARANEKECESTDELSEASSPKSVSAHQYHEKDVDDAETMTDGGGEGQGFSPSHDPDGFEVMEAKAAAARISELEEELEQYQTKSAQALDNVVMMQRKLDEANNTIQAERLESCNQSKVIQNLKREVEELQASLDETTKAKCNLRKERSYEEEIESEPNGEESDCGNVAKLDSTKEKHRDELNRLSIDLEDESHSRSSMDRHVMDLRRELERLQSENACEWGKRERLESEKLLMERDNKKLRAQVKDLEEELDRRSQASSSTNNMDMKTLQFELGERTKELSEFKHMNTKLKKAFGDRGTELEHNKRRAEQYEAEVRKLRGRIDELKHDLATAEDDVDSQSNAVRKAQRTNDELQEQVDGLQVQVNHLQLRLRRPGNVAASGTPRSSSLKTFNLEDSAAEFADSENDFDDI